MRSEQLEARARQAAFIGDAANYTEFTQQKLFDCLNDALVTRFSEVILTARTGYWLKKLVYTATAGQARFAIPPRALLGGLEKVEVSIDNGANFYALDQQPASQIQRYQTSGQTGNPWIYWVEGDIVEIVPAANVGMLVRLSYYIRPSQLVASQSDPNSTVRGRITAFNTSARTVTVNTVPLDQSLTVPVAITSALQSIDIVHPDGWHELALVGATQTLAGSVFTIGGTDPLTDVRVGDFVRVADQTDWPPLSDEFHPTLAEQAAIEILTDLHLLDKAAAIELKAAIAMNKLKSKLVPRVKSEPKQIGLVQRARGGGGPFYRGPV